MKKALKFILLSISLVFCSFSFIACDPIESAEVDSVTLDITSKSLAIGESIKLTATVIVPVEGTDVTVTWISSQKSVATVDSDGTVKGIAAGTTIITATSKANSTMKATCEIKVTDPNAATVYKNAGTYKVGTDINAGEYLLITDKQDDGVLSMGYYEVTKTANAAIGSSDFLYNNNFFYRSYILVEDGEYLEFSRCKLYKISEYPVVNKNATSWHSGQYKVGVDLDAGEYKLTTLANTSILDAGYVQFTRTPDGKIGTSNFISNANFENQKYITLEANTYVDFTKATLTKV